VEDVVQLKKIERDETEINIDKRRQSVLEEFERPKFEFEKRERPEVEMPEKRIAEKPEVAPEIVEQPEQYTRQPVAEAEAPVDGSKLTIETVKFEFTKPLEDVRVTEQENAIFECCVSHKDIPVRWYIGEVEVVPCPKYQVLSEEFTHRLAVNIVKPEDAGEVTAVFQDETSSAVLFVESLPLKIIDGLKDTEAITDMSASLACTLSMDDAELTWKKNGEVIKPDGKKYEEVIDGAVHTLHILDLTLDDDAEYTCHFGDDVSSCKLHVEEASAEIRVPLKEVQSVEGQTVSLSCELSKPDVPVVWLKDGVELQSDEHCALTVDGCMHSLTIHSATLEDEAEYTIRLNDSVSAKATLIARAHHCSAETRSNSF
jgi:hypothetical protein